VLFKSLKEAVKEMKKEFNLSGRIRKVSISKRNKFAMSMEPYLYVEDAKEFIRIFEKYIRGQNFNGTSFRLKSNIINRLREMAGEKLI
jgi:CTP:phosphocholine cytidylyltransferase-like protein